MTPAELKARVVEAADATTSPTRRAGARAALLLIGTGVAVAISIFFAAGGFAHGAGRPVWFEVATLVGWSCVAAWATRGAVHRGPRALGKTRRYLVVIALSTPAVLFAFMLVWNLVYPESLTAFPSRLGLRCFGLALAMGIWPLVALALARRSSDPVHPIATGAALGAAAGAWAGVLTDLWCPAAYPAHVAVGHILPIVVLACFGAGLGKRVIATRAPAR